MHRDNYKRLDFHPYEIVSGKELPIIIGSMPESFNEAVVDYQTAELIRYQYGFETLESMIGETIEVTVPLLSGRFFSGLKQFAHESSITISGIMPYSNPNQRQIFFLEGGLKETLLKGIVNEGADVSYTVVNFLLDSDSDFEKVCDKLNEVMPIDQNRFVMAINATNDGREIKNYQDPKMFIIYSILAIISIFLILIIYMVLNNKRIQKEKMILTVYGYSKKTEPLIRLGMIYSLCALIWLLSAPVVIEKLNEIVKSLHFDSFLETDYIWMTVMTIATYAFHYLLERLLGKMR